MTSDVDRRRRHGSPAGPATVEAVAGLRWREPRRAAELAQQVLGDAAERGDAGTWLRAAGWLLCGRSAVGDAREVALDILADVDTRAGRDVLGRPEAGRLRVELAALAQSNGDPDIARDLLDGWQPAAPDAGAEPDELELDRVAVLVRCALVDGAGDLAALRAEVEALARRMSGEPEALAELLLGSVHRDDGEPAAAAERALRGLARLGWTPDDPASPPTSPHLGCALLSQWATALLEGGAAADIPDGVKQLEVVDGGRHGVLWRLAVARAFAGRARPTADVLEDAASAAAAVDAPSLEAACRSAQAELFEGAGRYQDALTAMRAAMDAERTDRERAERLREALAGPAAALVEALGSEAGTDPAARTGLTVLEREPADRFDGPSPEFGRLPSVSDVADRYRASVASASEPPLDADKPGDAGASGPAMATLDLGLAAFDDAAAGSALVNGHRVPDEPAAVAGDSSPNRLSDGGSGVGEGGGLRMPGERATDGPVGRGVDGLGLEPDDAGRGDAAPVPGSGGVHGSIDIGRDTGLGSAESGPEPDVAWQLPGSHGVDIASGEGEGSPLADALLAELRAAVRDLSRPTASSAPAAGSVVAVGSDAESPSAAAAPGRAAPPSETASSPDVLPPSEHARSTEDAYSTGLAPASATAPSSGDAVEPPVAVDGGAAVAPTIVLELVGSDGQSVRHRDLAAVGADLTGRARRLVPADAVVRGADDAEDGVVPDAVAEVSVPGAEGVALQLWARSLVGLASRIPRRGLPEGTVLRATVRGSGGAVGDVQERPLTGPSTSDDQRPSPRPRTSGSADVAPAADVGDPAAAGRGTVARSDVRPGSGGRRRKVADSDESTSQADRPEDNAGGARVNGASVEHLRRGGAAELGADGLGADGLGADGLGAGQHGADGLGADDAPGRPEVQRPGRRRRAEDTDAGAGADPSPMLNGARRPHPGRSVPVDGASVAVPSDSVAGDGVPTDDSPKPNGRRQTRAEARRAATELPGSGASRGDASPADGAATEIGRTDPPPHDGGTGPATDDDAGPPVVPGNACDRGSDPWPARRPDPLDTNVPVEDVVPDGAVRLKGEWVVPGPLEQVTADVVRNGHPRADGGAHLAGAPRLPAVVDVPESPGAGTGSTDTAAEEVAEPPRRRRAAGSHRADHAPHQPTDAPDAAAAGSRDAARDVASEDAGPEPTDAPDAAAAVSRDAPRDGASDDAGSASGTEATTGTEAAPAPTDPATSREEPGTGSSSPGREGRERRDRRPRTERRSGRGGRGRDVPATGGDPTAIPDDLGLGDLLAGALAAYRDI